MVVAKVNGYTAVLNCFINRFVNLYYVSDMCNLGDLTVDSQQSRTIGVKRMLPTSVKFGSTCN